MESEGRGRHRAEGGTIEIELRECRRQTRVVKLRWGRTQEEGRRQHVMAWRACVPPGTADGAGGRVVGSYGWHDDWVLFLVGRRRGERAIAADRAQRSAAGRRHRNS